MWGYPAVIVLSGTCWMTWAESCPPSQSLCPSVTMMMVWPSMNCNRRKSANARGVSGARHRMCSVTVSYRRVSSLDKVGDQRGFYEHAEAETTSYALASSFPCLWGQLLLECARMQLPWNQDSQCNVCKKKAEHPVLSAPLTASHHLLSS